MRAVVWTDFFQAIVMFGGMLAIVIQVGTMQPHKATCRKNHDRSLLSVRQQLAVGNMLGMF